MASRGLVSRSGQQRLNQPSRQVWPFGRLPAGPFSGESLRVESSPHDDVSRACLEALDEPFFRMSAVRDDAGRLSNFTYDYCNQAALNAIGRKSADVLDKRLLDLFPSAETNGLFDAFVRVTETGEPARHEFTFGESGVTGDFEAAVSRFRDGVLLLGHDISRRKRDERQLAMLAEQLQGALSSRVMIEQAKGYLAAKYETDTATAFTAMRQYARNHNLRLHDVAGDIVAGRLDLTRGEDAR